MSRTGLRKYSGEAAQRYVAQVLATYGRVCHLCGRPGANSADHVIPRSQRPDLAFDVSNGRPAHRRCNSSRGDRPLMAVEEASGW